MVDLLAALIGRDEKESVRHDWSGLTFNGNPLFGYQQTLTGDKVKIPAAFEEYVAEGFKESAVVFACEAVRLSVFSEARIAYRRLNAGRPGEVYSTSSLNIMRHPWPGATTGDLLTTALSHADFAGNSFAVRRIRNGVRSERIQLPRPDWMQIVIGLPDGEAPEDPTVDPVHDLGGVVVGYLYHPGGIHRGDPVPLMANEVAHFKPIPDPVAPWRGMSWLTPVAREVAGDKQATVHKNKFYQNGATPNMIVKTGFEDPEIYEKWVTLFRERMEGASNAYKSLVLGAGMDATVVGRDFQQLDFKAVQGAAETRIAAASGVGAVMAQLSEGLQGSSLNAGNYAAARRRVADALFRPLWRSFVGSYETILPIPRNSELWYDDRDIAFLREDEKDAASIQQTRAITVRSFLDGGFTAESAVAAVENDDLKLLEHTGLFSVQLQPANSSAPVDNSSNMGEDSSTI